MKIPGFVFVFFAFVVGIVPQLTECLAHGSVMKLANGMTAPMKCHWTAQAELAAAVPMLALGVLVAINRRKEILSNLAILGSVLGLVVVLLPTALIGVCPSSMMLCNMVMRPTLILTGILTIVINMWILAVTLRQTVSRVVPGAVG